MSLREQIRPLLKQVMVHPKFVDDAQLAQVLPIQLATRITPEMEAGEAAALKDVEGDMVAQGVEQGHFFEVADTQVGGGGLEIVGL